MTLRRTLLLFSIIALVAVACGSDSPAADDQQVQGLDTSSPAAGACLAGDPDCQDLGPLPSGDDPLLPGEPAGDPVGGPVTPLDGGGLSVGDVVRNDIDGGFAIQGFYFDDGRGPRLCDALAESYPPQCGGDVIPFDNTAGIDLGPLQNANGVTWSDGFVVVVGEVVDGVFVATPIEN
jgi:hypothetical protein